MDLSASVAKIPTCADEIRRIFNGEGIEVRLSTEVIRVEVRRGR